MLQNSIPGHHPRVPIHVPGKDIAIEYRWIDPEKSDADLIIFLHEGLGSVSMWRDWPARLCAASNCRGLVYSRYGYGASSPRPHDEKWPVTFMHTQAEIFLPALLSALDLQDERPILYGHSDGGSIALLYAAMYPERVRALAVAAPHICVEDVAISSIAMAREAYLNTDLKNKLARYHQDPDSAFWGWNDIWLDPVFRTWAIGAYVEHIRCPVLAIQGTDDEYGTLEQIYGIKRLVTQTELCIIANCRHSPHKDQPDKVIEAVTRLIRSLN